MTDKLPSSSPTPSSLSSYSESQQAAYISVRLPSSGEPIVVYAVLTLSILVYLFQVLSKMILGSDLPLYLGAKWNEAIQAGQIWRLFTPMLLHGSLLHIGFNMYALLVIGRALENYYGHLRFLLLYLLAGYAGNVMSFLMSPDLSVGASTALFGLIAAQGIFIIKNRFLFGQQRSLSMILNTLFIVLVNLFIGLSPGIDNWGHLGGLIGGFTFAWFAGPAYHVGGEVPNLYLAENKPEQRTWLTVIILGTALSFLVALIVLLR
jgi:rhomboid protease GluP